LILEEDGVNFLLVIIVGTAVGFLATRMMKIEASVSETVVIGIGGALIGGVLIRYLLNFTGWIAGFAGTVLGALFLMWFWKTYIKGR
jgi:uncharacterized membrane protein YeaQ/YmgE (transglycosylase-associated protein family)